MMKDLDPVRPAHPQHGFPRIEVETEPFRPGEVKIGVQQYDEKLGWYTAASLRVPVAQLSALQEAVSRLLDRFRESEAEERKIIPLPLSD